MSIQAQLIERKKLLREMDAETDPVKKDQLQKQADSILELLQQSSETLSTEDAYGLMSS